MAQLPEDETTVEPEPNNSWARPIARLDATGLPPGAEKLNLDGREILSPLQGFGRLWRKTYRVRLPGVNMTPAEVMKIWKDNFPGFQPAETRFYPPPEGIQPGSILVIDLELPVVRGLPNAIPVASGVMVVYADDISFTVMTPQGFPVSGWNTFSVYDDAGCVVAQVQSIERATDPIYEFGSMIMGGAGRQEENWHYVLRALARHFGLDQAVKLEKELIDPRWQWSEAKNVWYNAGVRTFFYKLGKPFMRGKK